MGTPVESAGEVEVEPPWGPGSAGGFLSARPLLRKWVCVVGRTMPGGLTSCCIQVPSHEGLSPTQRLVPPHWAIRWCLLLPLVPGCSEGQVGTGGLLTPGTQT